MGSNLAFSWIVFTLLTLYILQKNNDFPVYNLITISAIIIFFYYYYFFALI